MKRKIIQQSMRGRGRTLSGKYEENPRSLRAEGLLI